MEWFKGEARLQFVGVKVGISTADVSFCTIGDCCCLKQELTIG
jgi:hypothetical protein